jgi:hypothetical protein
MPAMIPQDLLGDEVDNTHASRNPLLAEIY